MSEWTFSDVQVLIAEGKRREPELFSRLEKAAVILLLRELREVSGSPGVFDVESDTKSGKFHRVLATGVCDCIDFTRGRAPVYGRQIWCKHNLAVFMQKRLRERVAARVAERERERALLEACQAFAKLLRTPP